QRVAIARAMANDPPIIVADEPTGNLDSRTADSIYLLFEELVSAGKTILMVTHDDELAHRVTRTVTIADGLIVDDVKRATVAAPHSVDAAQPAANPARDAAPGSSSEHHPHPQPVLNPGVNYA
ncbi:MAG: hypothetical protein KDD78_08470, partial [Caldilineaceae bacterium]|nr:hypothetical protein [Caldilineaceae bacterium]